MIGAGGMVITPEIKQHQSNRYSTFGIFIHGGRQDVREIANCINYSDVESTAEPKKSNAMPMPIYLAWSS
jgi:hypothetical protein